MESSSSSAAGLAGFAGAGLAGSGFFFGGAFVGASSSSAAAANVVPHLGHLTFLPTGIGVAVFNTALQSGHFKRETIMRVDPAEPSSPARPPQCTSSSFALKLEIRNPTSEIRTDAEQVSPGVYVWSFGFSISYFGFGRRRAARC